VNGCTKEKNGRIDEEGERRERRMAVERKRIQRTKTKKDFERTVFHSSGTICRL
jgi:hypothetical protein